MVVIHRYECHIMIRGHASFWINIQGEHKILRFVLYKRIEWGVIPIPHYRQKMVKKRMASEEISL